MRTFIMAFASIGFSCPLFGAQEGGLPKPSPAELIHARSAESENPILQAFSGGDAATKESSRVTIDGESRTRFSDNGYPWRAIGKVKFGKNAGWGCTGALVGPRHLLTNSHCVDKNYPIYFYPSYHNGNFLTGVQKETFAIHYWSGNSPSTTDPTFKLPDGFKGENDWSVLALNERAGDTFGWLGSKNWNDSWYGKYFWTMVSYPIIPLNESGKYPLWEKNCAVKDLADGSLQHTCDVQGGASGSPIFAWWDKNPYIVALNWGEHGNSPCNYNKDNCFNAAVKEQKFNAAIKKAKEEYP